MKSFFKPQLLPWITLGLGGIGLALRIWLQSAVDEKGLLPQDHIAQILLFVLTAVLLVVLFLCARPLSPVGKYSRLFPASLFRALGCAAGAAGILIAAIGQFSSSNVLGIATFVLGLPAAACLGYIALCRYKAIQPSYLFYAVITLFLMIYTVCRCRNWGSEPQLLEYFFQLLTSVFLMLTAYYQTVLTSQKGSRRWFVFCSQGAAFCCCVSLAGPDKIFYLLMSAWLCLDLCTLKIKRPRPAKEEA